MTVRDDAEARLWRALVRLGSVNSVLQTGAHPDDEASALLARLALGDGVRTGYACAVRGEGGQNAIGPETGSALGLLRTLEMEAAARVLGVDLYWLNQELDGPLRDFGFARTPEAAFAVWGRARLVERLVRAIRTHRPDALLPSFLDVPGQHGHHRAVTQATIEAFARAGDPEAFPEHAAAGLAPFAPASLWLPAWSGAGATYADAAPPPPASLIVEAGVRDPVLGLTYAQVGEASRACHQSQGMGVRRDDGPWPVPLHRLATRVAGGAPVSLFDGLPRTLGELADTLPAAPARALRPAQAAIDAARAAFPRRDAVADAVHAALAAARRAAAALDGNDSAADARARIAATLRRLAQASRAAVLPQARCVLDPAVVVPGATLAVAIEPGPDAPADLAAAVVAPAGFAVARRDALRFDATAAPDAGFTNPYRFAVPADGHPPEHPEGPAGSLYGVLRYAIAGTAVEVPLAPQAPLAIVPAATLDAAPSAVPWTAAAAPSVVLTLGTSGAPRVAVEAPPHWATSAPAAVPDAPGRLAFTVLPPQAGAAATATLRPTIDGAPAHSLMRIAHRDPALGAAVAVRPVAITVRRIDMAMPDARIAWVDGGFERSWHWLRAAGLTVALLPDERVAALADVDTLVIGVFALRTRPALRAAWPAVMRWVHAGGHLVTLYHRPQDGWDPDAVPPHRLIIGTPSVRWRVCDPAAPVAVLSPAHPLLTRPNAIGPADWDGWVRERGLYFAADWARAYQPLLELADPGEASLAGGLLTARCGAGRHTHVALALHHQLPALVPGGYRLMANLMAPARSRAAAAAATETG